MSDAHLHQQKPDGASCEHARTDIVPQSQMPHPAYAHAPQPGDAHAPASSQPRAGTMHPQGGMQDADGLHRSVLNQSHILTEQHEGIQGAAKQEPAAIAQKSDQMRTSQDQAAASCDPSALGGRCIGIPRKSEEAVWGKA